jgi:hypothetical protein
MTTLVLFATPGAPDRATLAKYEEALRPLGSVALRLIPIPGFSSVFKREAHALRDGEGRLLPRTLAKYAPGVSVTRLAFIGYSAGCWYARDGLFAHEDDRAAIDAALMLDGLHGTKAQLEHAIAYSETGALISTHTDVQTQGYPSTTETAETLAIEAPLATIIHRTPKLGETQKQQHGRSLTQHGPEVVRDHLVPILKSLEADGTSGNQSVSGDRQRDEDPPPDTDPDPDAWRAPDLSLAERMCEWLGFEFGHKVREIPGSQHNPRIVGYSQQCRRRGTFLGVNSAGEPEWDLSTDRGFPLPLPTDELAWCAAFRSACLLANLLPGEEPPHGLRVSVREQCEDARAAGTLRLVGSGYVPKPGDAVIKARNGQNPLHGGQGHVHTIIVTWDVDVLPDGTLGAGGYRAIGGNEGNAVRVRDWSLTDAAVVAFIET